MHIKKKQQQMKQKLRKLEIITAMVMIAVFCFVIAITAVEVFAEEAAAEVPTVPAADLTEVINALNQLIDQPAPDNSDVVTALDRLLGQLISMQETEASTAAQAAQNMNELRRAIGIPGTAAAPIRPAAAAGETTLGDLPIGERVQISESGVLRNYIIVQQGSPSAAYYGFDNATILLRERTLPNRPMHPTNVNDYQNSAMAAWLNDEFLNTVDAEIRNKILQIRIPHRPGSGPSTEVNQGANGLQTRVFLLSMTEVGFEEEDSWQPIQVEGVMLSYFTRLEMWASNSHMQAYNDAGNQILWWLRSPDAGIPDSFWGVEARGAANSNRAGIAWAAPRPAFALPANLIVENGTVTAQTPGTGNGFPGNIGEGLMGLLSTLIQRTEALTAEVRIMETMVQENLGGGHQISVWQIAVGAFQAAVSIVIIFALGWRGA